MIRTRRPPHGRRAAVLPPLLGLVLALAGCGGSASSGSPADPTRTATAASASASAHFSDSGVDVTLQVTEWNGNSGMLTAVLRPERATYHLYSVSLPLHGIDGVGRPTRVSVTGAVQSRGLPSASAPVHQLVVPGIPLPLPVYPDGPVTVTVPIRAARSGAAITSVSYAACSATYGCMVPVTGHRVELTVAGGRISFGGAD
jgi:hypothetical protein